eukprot:TRINITY_DN5230_c0_g1_i1.p1 TRINITY_DN5230_c0_g1~~TRINITY_DN5230_c0_g1_i1.p1  ORF type:complete len:913 (+),score=330.40 TRINITY_DN5230_c0_g1_i1:1500-4238(+)
MHNRAALRHCRHYRWTMSDDQKLPSFCNEEQSTDTYRFAVRGKAPQVYYQLYGSQVEGIAKEYLHTTAVIKQVGPHPTIHISAKVFLQMALDLIRNKGMKIELYESSGSTWNCTLQASPGRLEQFEARFGSVQVQDTGCIVAIQYKLDQSGYVQFGCGYVNQTLRVLGLAEFVDNATNLTNLESFLLQIGAREAIIPQKASSTAEDIRIADTVKNAGVHLETERHKIFAVGALEDRLRFLLRDNTSHDALQLPLAPSSLSAIITHLDLSADECNEQQFTLRKEDLSKFLKLDLAAVRALNLFDDESENMTRSKGSLCSFLDECKTQMGKRELRLWVTQPLLDIQEITRRQDLTSVFMDDMLLRDALRATVLTKVPDLDRILKRIQRQRASLADCMSIGNFVSLIPKLLTLLEAYGGAHKERIDTYMDTIRTAADTFGGLESLMAESLEVDESDKQVRIKADFDDDLKDLEAEMKQVRDQMNGEFKKVLQLLKHTDKEIKLECNQQHGHHFKATKKGSGAVNSRKDMIIIESRKDNLRFTSQGLSEINASWKELSDKYASRQTELEKMFKDTVATYLEPLDGISAIIAEVDIFVAFATVSTRPGVKQFVRPVVLPMPLDGQPKVLKATQARHPLVEQQLALKGNSEFVANDINLGGDTALMALITGPNMGGKSTYIRTAGVLVLLAQIGMMVPADEMVVSLCDMILARLGAADYMSRGVSTFMAEMLETNAIISNATSNSFVIIDELGRGTSTHDGYGLAWGIAEHLVKSTKCITMFATHFHELTVMENECPLVTNLHVTADTSGSELKMLYEVKKGPCSKSYGINVAQITKFPEAVIAAAKRKTEALEASSNKKLRTEADPQGPNAYLKSWLSSLVALPPDAPPASYTALLQDFEAHTAKEPSLKEILAASS